VLPPKQELLLNALSVAALGLLASTEPQPAMQPSTLQGPHSLPLTLTPTGNTANAQRRLLTLSAEPDPLSTESTQYTVYSYEGAVFTIVGLGRGCDYVPPNTAVFSKSQDGLAEQPLPVDCWDADERPTRDVEGTLSTLGLRKIVVGQSNMSHCQPVAENVTFHILASKIESSPLPCDDAPRWGLAKKVAGAGTAASLCLCSVALLYTCKRLRNARSARAMLPVMEMQNAQRMAAPQEPPPPYSA